MRENVNFGGWSGKIGNKDKSSNFKDTSVLTIVIC